MAESANEFQKRAVLTEQTLLHNVQRTQAIFRGSLNGARASAKLEFEEALRVFSNLVIRYQLPKA
jgi:hypothetical protein